MPSSRLLRRPCLPSGRPWRAALGDAALNRFDGLRVVPDSPGTARQASRRRRPWRRPCAAASLLASAVFPVLHCVLAALSRRVFTSMSRFSTKTLFVKPCSSTGLRFAGELLVERELRHFLVLVRLLHHVHVHREAHDVDLLDVVEIALAQRRHQVLPVLGLRVVDAPASRKPWRRSCCRSPSDRPRARAAAAVPSATATAARVAMTSFITRTAFLLSPDW